MARWALGGIFTQRARPTAGIAIPHWNAVAPPQLTRDIPVANVLEPVLVHRDPAFRDEPYRAGLDGSECRSRQRGHLHKPLIRESRLDDRVAPVAVTDRVLM